MRRSRRIGNGVYLRAMPLSCNQRRNRTTDTAIFSHTLYQLSYLGAAPDGRRLVAGEPCPVQKPALFSALIAWRAALLRHKLLRAGG